MATQYNKKDWHAYEIIGNNDLNNIEKQIKVLTDNTVWSDEIGDTLERAETLPHTLNVKQMSSSAGGITPTPPSEEQDKSILFADGYDKLQVTGEVSSSNDARNYSLSRSNNEQLTSFSVPAVTTSALGLMSSTDKSRIDSVWNGNLNENTIITNSNMVTQGENLGFVTDNNFSTKIATIGAPTTSVKGLVPVLPTGDNLDKTYLNAQGNWKTWSINDIPDNSSLNSKLENINGLTAAYYGQDSNINLSFGNTFTVPYFYVNAKGRVTVAQNKTITIPSFPNTEEIIIWTNAAQNNGLSAGNQGTYFSWNSPTITRNPKYLIMILITDVNLAYKFGYVIFPYSGIVDNYWYFNYAINHDWDTSTQQRGIYYGFISDLGYCCRRFGRVAIQVGGGYSDINYYGNGYLNGSADAKYCVPYQMRIVY